MRSGEVGEFVAESADVRRDSWQAPQEFEGIFFVQPNKQDKPNKRIRLAGHAGSRFEVSVTPPTIPHSQFIIHHSSFPIPLHLSVINSKPRTQNSELPFPSPCTPLPLTSLARLGFLISLKLRTQNFPARPPYPFTSTHLLLTTYHSPLTIYYFERIGQFPIYLACIGNTSPLTTLPFNSYRVIIFHDGHLGSLPPPPIDFAGQWNP